MSLNSKHVLWNYKLYQSGYIIGYAGNTSNVKRVCPIKRNRRYTVNKIKLRSACVSLFKQKKGICLLFLTVTMPFKISEKEMARIWKNFLVNLRNNYNIGSYAWVKEYQKNGNPHYHVLLDTTFIDIERLQETFNNCIYYVTSRKPVFNNSLRLGNNPRVFSINRVANYLAKYFVKGEKLYRVENSSKDNLKPELYFEGRAYGYSEDLLLSKVIDYSDLFCLDSKYSLQIIALEPYYVIIKLRNYQYEENF